jgi:phage virion morphogenesis protein
MAVFNVDVEAAAAALAMRAFAMRGTASLMETLGILVEGQTKRRFATKTSPDGAAWAALKPSTIARRRKKSSSILTDTGRLMGSISHTSSARQAIIGTNVFYGPFHQRGTSRMVARPFLGVGAKDMAEIKAAVEAWAGALT